MTGYLKFDAIRNGDLRRDDILQGWDIDPTKKIVLFAPTFNNELSAVPLVAEKVRDWAGNGRHLIIKLHGMSPPEWFDLYRLIAE